MEPLEIGNLSLFPFGAALALALAAGAGWSRKRAGDDREKRTLEIFWIIALPLGLFLAHLGWLLCELDMYEDMFLEMIGDFPGGGYMLYGALLGAAVALGISCRVTKASFGRTADLLAGPFLLFGAACALGEGLVGCGEGWKVEDWFLAENSMSLLAAEEPGPLSDFFSRFPFAVQDSFYGYASWAVFLPVGLFLLAAALILSITEKRGAGLGIARRPGSAAVLSLSLYAAVRILYESLRQDDIPKWGFVRVNQILSAVLLLLLLIICWRQVRRGLGASLGLLLGGAALVMAMEFALEKKIGFLEWMTMDLCYLVSGIGCCMMFQAVNRLRLMGSAGKEKTGRPAD